jgi:hypothetical protein
VVALFKAAFAHAVVECGRVERFHTVLAVLAAVSARAVGQRGQSERLLTMLTVFVAAAVSAQVLAEVVVELEPY